MSGELPGQQVQIFDGRIGILSSGDFLSIEGEAIARSWIEDDFGTVLLSREVRTWSSDCSSIRYQYAPEQSPEDYLKLENIYSGVIVELNYVDGEVQEISISQVPTDPRLILVEANYDVDGFLRFIVDSNYDGVMESTKRTIRCECMVKDFKGGIYDIVWDDTEEIFYRLFQHESTIELLKWANREIGRYVDKTIRMPRELPDEDLQRLLGYKPWYELDFSKLMQTTVKLG